MGRQPFSSSSALWAGAQLGGGEDAPPSPRMKLALRGLCSGCTVCSGPRRVPASYLLASSPPRPKEGGGRRREGQAACGWWLHSKRKQLCCRERRSSQGCCVLLEKVLCNLCPSINESGPE